MGHGDQEDEVDRTGPHTATSRFVFGLGLGLTARYEVMSWVDATWFF